MGVVVDKLPWVVYAAIWAVGVGYWFVPVEPAQTVAASHTRRATTTRQPEQPAAPVVMAMAGGTPSSSAAVLPKPVPTATATDVAPAVPASAPEVLERVKPLLNRGTDLASASANFRDAVEFAAVAHAARNTRVPFVVLKHRVLAEQMSLSEAIRASLPQVDADVEADLALAEARADVAALGR